MRKLVGAGVALCLLAGAGPAQALRELGSVSLATPATPEDVEVAGDLAYVVTSRTRSSGLHVLDVSDPSAPVEIAFAPDLGGNEIEIAGGLAYVAGGDLKIVDVSDPTAPALLGSASLSRPGSYLAIAGGRAYVSDRRRNLSIVDISDPAHPVEVGTFETQSFQVYDVAADGNLAFLTLAAPGAGTGFVVVDASDPSAPVEVGRSLPFGSIGGDPDPRIELEGGRAYLTGASTGEFAIVDVSDPAAPLELSRIDLEQFPVFPGLTPATDLQVVGTHAYLAIRFSATTPGMLVIDVSDPTAPEVRGTLGGAATRSEAIAVASGRAHLLSAAKDLQIIDLGNPGKPEILGAAAARAGFGLAITLDGGLAHVLSDSGNLLVFDVSDPAAPVQVGSAELERRIRFPEIEAANGWVYAGMGDSRAPARVRIVDVSDPAAPVPVAELELAAEGVTNDLQVVGDLLYVLYSGGGSFLRVLDVSDPAAPLERATFELEFPFGFADAMEVVGGLAYVAATADHRKAELRILDLADPAAIREVARLPLEGEVSRVRDIAVADGFAYVVSDPLSGIPSLWVIDVRDPARPLQVTRLDDQFSNGTIRVVDGRAYLGGSGRADVFDVSDPAAPLFLGGAGFALDLEVADGLVHVVNPGALAIIDFGPEFAPNQPPVADAGPDQRLECAGPDGARVALDGRASHDPDGDPLDFAWSGPFGSASGPTPGVDLPVGRHAIALEVTDPAGAVASDEMVVTVEDTRPPAAWASFEQVRGPAQDGKRGLRFRAAFACADVCDAAPGAEAEVAGQAVEDGEIVAFKGAGRPFDRPLRLTCEDAAGHSSRAEAEPRVGAGKDD